MFATLTLAAVAVAFSGVAPGAAASEPNATAAGGIFGAYVVDWAHYRSSPYTWSVSDLAPIAPRLDTVMFSFIYFCPPAGTSPMPYWASAPYGHCTDATEYQLMSVDDSDATAIPAATKLGPKVVISIGGWNFPSSYFSTMASSAASRGKFIASIQKWVTQYSLAGVDLDWEYPCSPARANPVKISCAKFQNVADTGGNCPGDTANLLSLVKEMRQALGPDKLISLASQASAKLSDEMNLKAVSEYIDTWHIMTYDYAVSDVPGASVTSPNAPLYNPPQGSGAIQMSINQTINHYVSAGVPKSKIHVGLPLYAHTWYVPGLAGTDWQTFGKAGVNQGECCGPFKATMGAKPGQGCQLCGSMMYSEIMAAKPQTYHDTTTDSTIAYVTGKGADAYTEAGTWLTYNDVESVKKITQWAMDEGLAGTFIYSADMDTASYTLMNAIADTMGKAPPSPAPPGPSPSPAPPGTAPTCAAAGKPEECQTVCASKCRGYPPGFGAAGCVDISDCLSTPSWAKGSVCLCP